MFPAVGWSCIVNGGPKFCGIQMETRGEGCGRSGRWSPRRTAVKDSHLRVFGKPEEDLEFICGS